ncbi:MAG: hypothetical protein AAF579_21885 [Cyanobacteria bacterium P01_C01_bin.118]
MTRLTALYQQTGQPAKAQALIAEYDNRIYGLSPLVSRLPLVTPGFYLSDLPYRTCDQPDEDRYGPAAYTRIHRRGHNPYRRPASAPSLPTAPARRFPPIRTVPPSPSLPPLPESEPVE